MQGGCKEGARRVQGGCKEGARRGAAVTLGSLWEHFEPSLDTLLAYESKFGIIIMSSWVCEGHFAKIHIFQWNFNDFIQVLHQFGGTLGQLSCHTGLTLGVWG